MTTEEEVMRLLRQADPDRRRAHVPSIDGTDYLAALRTRSSNVDYFDAELTLTEPPTNRHRWLIAAAAAATVAVIAGGLVLAARDDDDDGGRDRPGTGDGAATGDGATGDDTTPPSDEIGRH